MFKICKTFNALQSCPINTYFQLMKRISRPPDVMTEEARWEQLITELLNCYHYHDNDADHPLKYLSHEHGNNLIA